MWTIYKSFSVFKITWNVSYEVSWFLVYLTSNNLSTPSSSYVSMNINFEKLDWPHHLNAVVQIFFKNESCQIQVAILFAVLWQFLVFCQLKILDLVCRIDIAVGLCALKLLLSNIIKPLHEKGACSFDIDTPIHFWVLLWEKLFCRVLQLYISTALSDLREFYFVCK